MCNLYYLFRPLNLLHQRISGENTAGSNVSNKSQRGQKGCELLNYDNKLRLGKEAKINSNPITLSAFKVFQTADQNWPFSSLRCIYICFNVD